MPANVRPENMERITTPELAEKFIEEQGIDLAMQGAFASVEDYMDKLPNFKKTFVDNKDNNWIFKSYAAPDGKLYGYYGWDYSRDINTNATMYRKDIFDKHGLKMWNNPEEFSRVGLLGTRYYRV